MTRHTISNRDDIIDSRDVIARIDELEEELAQAHTDDDDAGEDFEEWLTALAESYDGTGREEPAKELLALRALQDDAEGYCPDWHHGATLIRESYFQTYARELADDIGAINRDAGWPTSCIDWEQAAEELQQDYTNVEYDGVSYWVQ